MRAKRSVLLCLLAMLLLLSASCTSAEDLPTSEKDGLLSAESETTTTGSILPAQFSLPYLAGKTLDPITCQEGPQQVVASLIYEGLVRLSPTLEPQLWLCTRSLYDAASNTYTLTLRSDVTFSDGSPLTAQDVKATLERARHSERYASRLTAVSSISAQDDRTVIITLTAPNTNFLSLLDIPIVKRGTETSTVPVGTGPYLCSDVSGGFSLIANQLWWRTDTLPVERIALLETADTESLRYRLTSHDIQLVTADLTGINPITATGNIVYQDVDTTIFQYIGLNVTRAPLNDQAFRTTLSAGLNRSLLVNAFLSGHASAAQFPVSPVSALYPTELEQEYSLTAFSQAVSALTNLPQQPLTLLVNQENSFKVSLAEELAQTYTAAGIPMNVRALSWVEYTAALENGDFDLYFGEVKLTADWNLSSLLGTGGTLNYGGWSNAQTDALLRAYAAAEDPTTAMKSLCSHLQRTAPLLPICFKRTSVLMQSNVIANLESTMAEPFYGLSTCQIYLKDNPAGIS